MKPTTDFEVIIIGGSYSGLSAAMALGRSLRNTLIIDAGKPCNRQTPHSHNFLTQDGSTPQEITEIARKQVAKYDTVKFYHGTAIGGKKVEGGFDIKTSGGDIFHTKKLILATGIKDLMPSIEGFTECWGISVVHCPYCHGYEIRNKKTAIMANGDTAIHLASLVNNLSKDITILTEGEKTFEDQQLQKLSKHGIKILEKEISAIEHEAGYMKNIHFKDGSRETFEAAYAAIPFEQNAIPVELGCKLTENGYIEVGPMGKTSVDGVLACGDNSYMMRSVATAVYSGNMAGAVINHELTQEGF
ncbi:NAD(P)/FAD-dependent oxidoreductase [Cyclobacterium qasimii]|nr:NAD(P)/FAD-dependent oxidoreductase [Cyclobacterium qasimii]EPR67677.1 Thioredoxin reductase [Cyclobacterium qasimii M12-11B]